jgi:serine/threonine protein kinase
MSAPEPVRFGQYAATRILGRGALGRVYHGHDPLEGRQVALRVIRARAGHQLKAVPRLSHPGIITVYDVGEAGRNAFIAMEFASGGSLEDQIESGVEFSPDQVVEIASQVAEALDYAHGQGVIHQDVRPANILVADDGRYKLTDFRIDDIDELLDPEEHGVRPPPYCLSPEQARGLPVTPSTDQFSLAAVVYRLLSGRRPFDGDTAEAVKLQILEIEPPSPSAVNPRLSAVVSQVVMTALSKEPSERYAHCRAFADALSHSLAAPAARQSTAPSPAPDIAPDAGLTWDDTVLDVGESSPAQETSYSSSPPVRRRSRFATAVVGVVVVVVVSWLVWSLDLLGPPRIETTLAVESSPPDQSLAIWLDDVPVGLMTPADVLLEGEEGQSVRLDLVRDDEIVASTMVTLDGEMEREWIPEVEVPLRPVRYEVRSTPSGALVSLDGQDIARPTPVDIDLFPGQSYDIVVSFEGYEPGRRSVDPAELAPDIGSLDFSLARIVRPGRLLVQAAFPLTLVARSDGAGARRAEGRSPSLELPPGSYSVSIAAPDVFFEDEATVTVREAEDVVLPNVPTAVKVLVFDVPGDATVQIDDFAPFPSGGPRTVVVGPHRFVFEWPSGEQVIRDVEIERDGQEVSARHP